MRNGNSTNEVEWLPYNRFYASNYLHRLLSATGFNNNNNMPLAISSDDLQGVLQLCDPSSTGFVSMEYFTQLARAHYRDQAEADKLVNKLDGRGQGIITYQEFCNAINSILKDSGTRDNNIMMAPSIGQRDLTTTTTTNNSSGKSTIYMAADGHGHGETTDKNSRCSSISDGESFECYGQMDVDTSLTNPNNSHDNSGNGGNLRIGNGNLRRNTWLRTSLKRCSSNHENLPNRRWGSFRHSSGKRAGNNSLTNQLNRSSSFNSSGRSSACDTGDDVYSDISLEEDVLDLNHKVQVLQEQMSVLTDNQNHSDERYTRAKQENATLQARVLMLEEQLREVELRAQEKLQIEERRHRELVARVDREKQLQVENCAIRLQSLELENTSLREEAARCRAQAEKLRAEVSRLEEEQEHNETTLALLKDELEILREKERSNSETSLANQQLIEELTQEIERLRAEQRDTIQQLNSKSNGISPTAHEQLQAKFSQLRDDNRRLQEAHDEMQALLLTKRVEEGRSLLLTGHQSLAAELEAMSQDEPASESAEDIEVRTALKEQQEVNAQLRSYIDGILLNIVDNYPQLLEVKGGLP